MLTNQYRRPLVSFTVFLTNRRVYSFSINDFIKLIYLQKFNNTTFQAFSKQKM